MTSSSSLKKKTSTGNGSHPGGAGTGSNAACPNEGPGSPGRVQQGQETGNDAQAGGKAVCSKTPNRGRLIIDATCCPVNIRYPQDFSLLNQAREILDCIMDRICKDTGRRKPRTYRETARKKFISLAKKRRKGAAEIRSIIKYMLGCVCRNLNCLERLDPGGEGLLPKETAQVEVIQKLYGQQKYMYDNNVHQVENRIVSLHMPFIRPIVRGKVPTPTEFGPKIDVSVDGDGYSRIETFSYEAYNESTHLVEAISSYKERNGVYPEAVLVDAIYRNRDNIAFCKQHGIRISGPRLGKPPKDEEKSMALQDQESQDMVDRIEVERRFSRAKRCFGLGRIMEKTEDTVGSSTGLGILLDNLIPVGF